MLNWQSIETVLLDMDGTLLDLHFDNHFWMEHLPKRMAEIHQLDPADVKQQMHQRFITEYGSLNWYCTQYWAKELKLDIVALKQEVQDRIALLDNAKLFLEALSRSNKRVALVTNAHHESLNLKMNLINLRPHFDFVAVSHDYHHPKEAQAFWQGFAKSFEFNPSTTLFIDDNENVLSAAQQFGVEYLLAPKRPDSTKVARDTLNYPSFNNYAELLPISNHA